MWPWGHLAVGYLLYTAFVRMRERQAPSEWAALAVAFGTQFPDLIDKPLAWWLGVLPSGRTFAHSVLTALIVAALVYALARRRNATGLAIAFVVGYLSHSFADALLPLLQSHTEYVAYLLWPLLGLPFYQTEATVLASVGSFDLTVYGVAQLGLVLLALVVWVLDGAPGLHTLGRLFGIGEERGSDPNPDR
ncbi:metal-dependent hydrolase [Halobacteriales archaeon QS_3_64_16]|nr:MAG: metal-dependent hydrolase [Halobacteriales archaeon QS_3_64_16]